MTLRRLLGIHACHLPKQGQWSYVCVCVICGAMGSWLQEKISRWRKTDCSVCRRPLCRTESGSSHRPGFSTLLFLLQRGALTRSQNQLRDPPTQKKTRMVSSWSRLKPTPKGSPKTDTPNVSAKALGAAPDLLCQAGRAPALADGRFQRQRFHFPESVCGCD